MLRCGVTFILHNLSKYRLNATWSQQREKSFSTRVLTEAYQPVTSWNESRATRRFTAF